MFNTHPRFAKPKNTEGRMTIPVKKIKFGELDAKNELFQQDRYGQSIFMNSFQIPPKIDLDELKLGSRFFIYGQKGCGKTALMLYIQRILADCGANTHVILFKSGISETERAKIAGKIDFDLIDTKSGIDIQYNYLTNWLWMIYKNLLFLIKDEDIMDGHDYVTSLSKLFGVSKNMRRSVFSDLALGPLKLAAKLGLAAGPFNAEITTDVETAKRDIDNRGPQEIIEICERYIGKIILRPRNRCILFFDELELFWNRPDQRERDLFLIRDLLAAVARVNRIIGNNNASFVVYASVRSEVLEDVNRVGPEIGRDINDFGVPVQWNASVSSENQPILKIVEAKISASEIEEGILVSDDPWQAYFSEEKIYRKDIKRHLLDISMFKPRLIVSRLTLAAQFNGDAQKLQRERCKRLYWDFLKLHGVKLKKNCLADMRLKKSKA
ncbi:P-loop ATPase, Sll1717 family [Roseicella frigidaeris]|uniref:P-loop ATPase, Sll1717 family n=1 Tax=Roseicella frigidaeris TaxID=2230885 RepID=UPI000FDD990F|nr:hypothetical protein [Roseicella frigidaeris]